MTPILIVSAVCAWPGVARVSARTAALAESAASVDAVRLSSLLIDNLPGFFADRLFRVGSLLLVYPTVPGRQAGFWRLNSTI
jgi:hypothetical protein